MPTTAANPLKLIFNTQAFLVHYSSFLFIDHTNSILTPCYSSVCSATRNLFRFPSSDMLGLFSSSLSTVCSASLPNPYLIDHYVSVPLFLFLICLFHHLPKSFYLWWLFCLTLPHFSLHCPFI